MLLKNFILINNFSSFILNKKLSQKLNNFSTYKPFNKHGLIPKPIISRNYTFKNIYNQSSINYKNLSNIKFFKPIQQINLFRLYLHFANDIIKYL